jgi:hypothetical protein
MSLKVYRKNNFCVVETASEKKYFSCDEMTISSSASSDWVLTNSSNPAESFSFNYSILKDVDGNLVGTEEQVEDYLTLNTNFRPIN